MKKCSIITLLLFAIITIFAVEMPNYFSDNMVIQRDAPIKIFGKGMPNEDITVSLNGVSGKTTCDKSGNWLITLASQNAGGPFVLNVKGNNELSFKNVMIGEVWLCAGQSNMAWRLRESTNGADEVKNSTNSQIRLFQVERVWNSEQKGKASGKWQESNPESSKDFSAVGYFFGDKLSKELKVCVGLIDVSWGGTRIEPWLAYGSTKSYQTLRSISQELELFNPKSQMHKEILQGNINILDKYVTDLKNCKENESAPSDLPILNTNLIPKHRDASGMLFNTMVKPLLPANVGGMLWYQGEANRTEGLLYTDKLKALIDGWREQFMSPDMPFYIVQLAPMKYANQNWVSLANIWDAQSKAAKEINNAGIVIINDVGNPIDIHPTNKRPVGERLANLALKRNFNMNIPAEFPEANKFEIKNSDFIITFENAKELKTADQKSATNFELCGENGVFYPANTIINGNRITLSSNDVTSPVAARFAWNISCEPNLRNEHNLPVGAFKIGNIPQLNPIQNDIAESEGFNLIYELEPLQAKLNGKSINYKIDNSAEFIDKKIKRIGYFLELTKLNGSIEWIWVDMDTYTQKLDKIGVPLDVIFNIDVKNVLVASNTKNVMNGKFPNGCNIEFWPNNYRSENVRKLAGASNSVCDFGDTPPSTPSIGFGSMQIHNYGKKQTLMAYNYWKGGNSCDLGIGNNNSSKHPDWTSSKSGLSLKDAKLLILAQFE